MRQILIETVDADELKLVEAFIKEHKLKGFLVEDAKATEQDVFNDVVRMLIPIL